jgi:hypothetical protein
MLSARQRAPNHGALPEHHWSNKHFDARCMTPSSPALTNSAAPPPAASVIEEC